MSGKYNYDMMVWYMTLDYKDLYRIEKDGPVMYRVVSYGTYETVFCFPGLLGCLDFMEKNCFDHNQIKGGWMNNGK